MKLRFDANLDYQQQAIEAVCDLFHGQDICHSVFSVQRTMMVDQFALPMRDPGVGNILLLRGEQVLENLHKVQARHHLAPSPEIASIEELNFTVEMETGTGKTYVYLRTIYELNRQYGFSKFVIVVPSVAIKEGVYKALQMTEDHFRDLYAGTVCNYFLYDSSKLTRVREFAGSSTIQIMVVTVGAINKQDVNNLYKPTEKTGDDAPIDYIRGTRPIVIVDEPQSVDGGMKGQGKEALKRMHPLCTLRYSATHIEKHHMVYRLDAIDAYQRQLVKQIEVASLEVYGGHNAPYVKVSAIPRVRTGAIRAKIEVDVKTAGGVSRKDITVQDGDQLILHTDRDMYDQYTIGEIRCEKGHEFLELRYPGGPKFLKIGEAVGGVDQGSIHKEMIRRTIKEHLDKEKRLRPRGIKVLSLFFVPEVSTYRQYNDAGQPVKGPYALAFEEEYRRLVKHPDYVELFLGADLEPDATRVHEGYFAIDRKGAWAEVEEGEAEKNAGNRDATERAYTLIMKDKERLLSFETPLRFIFSHSALQEGWDNPNVFQICAMREFGTERKRRQTIGRGLRLCVDQTGERLQGFEVNTLTVVATESYQEFAEKLQKEIEEDTGIRFGIVEAHDFAAVIVTADGGAETPLGLDRSRELWDWLRSESFIDKSGKIQDTLRRALKEGSLDLPVAFIQQSGEVFDVLKKRAGRLEIKDARERTEIGLNKQVYLSEEFTALWDRIKHKTTYRVNFDNEKLITDCIDELRKDPAIPRPFQIWRKASLDVTEAGIETAQTSSSAPRALDIDQPELPDILTVLQDRTGLTRRSLATILKESHRFADFTVNPQEFIDRAVKAINRTKATAMVDGIKYERIGDQVYYAQQLFEDRELSGYLSTLVIDTKKSVHQHVVYQSDIERSFAEDLERNEAVKVYAKLPAWFKVETPLGPYNPDWAVLVNTEDGERLYFVVETKSTLNQGELRITEKAKIQCGIAHIDALQNQENPPQFKNAVSVDGLLSR